MCMRGDDREMLSLHGLSFLERQSALYSFSSQATTLSDEGCSDLTFENPNATPKNHTQYSHRDTPEVYAVFI